nr:acidic leucine-rich nuclear phosphoprotein 32 family member B-like [Aegilops tauschii subsp. strangulata]
MAGQKETTPDGRALSREEIPAREGSSCLTPNLMRVCLADTDLQSVGGEYFGWGGDDEEGLDEDVEEGLDKDDEDDEEGVDEDDEDDEEGDDEDNEEAGDEEDEDDEEWGDEEDEAEFYLGESALMAEQTAILESIQDEAYVESNRRFLLEEQAKTDVLFDELDAELQAEANDVDVRMEIVDIFDDGE